MGMPTWSVLLLLRVLVPAEGVLDAVLEHPQRVQGHVEHLVDVRVGVLHLPPFGGHGPFGGGGPAVTQGLHRSVQDAALAKPELGGQDLVTGDLGRVFGLGNDAPVGLKGAAELVHALPDVGHQQCKHLILVDGADHRIPAEGCLEQVVGLPHPRQPKVVEQLRGEPVLEDGEQLPRGDVARSGQNLLLRLEQNIGGHEANLQLQVVAFPFLIHVPCRDQQVGAVPLQRVGQHHLLPGAVALPRHQNDALGVQVVVQVCKGLGFRGLAPAPGGVRDGHQGVHLRAGQVDRPSEDAAEDADEGVRVEHCRGELARVGRHDRREGLPLGDGGGVLLPCAVEGRRPRQQFHPALVGPEDGAVDVLEGLHVGSEAAVRAEPLGHGPQGHGDQVVPVLHQGPDQGVGLGVRCGDAQCLRDLEQDLARRHDAGSDQNSLADVHGAHRGPILLRPARDTECWVRHGLGVEGC
mmetsp:Transcript_35068/g.62680  ORF Transcript_35068/g.62680 Transcript_35068/m.62680 type:complete len:465 (-) Transcript_35068:574-1968(-)